jgi:glycerol-3-phosphate dehydrogenase (NAD(P)+)
MGITRQSDGAIRTIGVVGAGAWGTALALSAARSGHNVIVWAREAAVVESVTARRENTAFLPGAMWPENVSATNDLNAMARADLVLLASPAQALRTVARELKPVLAQGTPVLICAKGMERRSGQLMSEVCEQELPDAMLGMLSGPSFATDVARGLPTAITLALRDADMGLALVQALSSPSLRLYYTTDATGVAVGGAIKNVLAIACGIVEGKGLGDSARAALTARGFAEMTRFGVALGARPETMTGLSGLGDLILTCSSRQSRNFMFGVGLAQGKRASENPGPLAEGAETAAALVQRAGELGVDMPIAHAVAQAIEGRLTVDDAIAQLLSRPLKTEV